MNILFRADASLDIGAGHVTRCATLAKHLTSAGHTCLFLCRPLPGNLISWLTEQGLRVVKLPDQSADEHADAEFCWAAVDNEAFDWLVVDHYSLGLAWEKRMTRYACQLLVIDDIARPHHCDLLLDQNYSSPLQERYRDSVPARCRLLLGTQYALVRPEFAALRARALARQRGELRRIVVCLGGSDIDNGTVTALQGIADAQFADLVVDVVIGSSNPHRASVAAACAELPHSTLHVQTSRMAELMCEADLAITAGGSTTWERCILGLPALVVVTADNQAVIAEAVAAAGAQFTLGRLPDVGRQAIAEALRELSPALLRRMSHQAASLCDGLGCGRVASAMLLQ